jgi:hypothetical protein
MRLFLVGHVHVFVLLSDNFHLFDCRFAGLSYKHLPHSSTVSIKQYIPFSSLPSSVLLFDARAESVKLEPPGLPDCLI